MGGKPGRGGGFRGPGHGRSGAGPRAVLRCRQPGDRRPISSTCGKTRPACTRSRNAKSSAASAPACAPTPASRCLAMYRYDEFDAQFVAERVGAIPPPGRAPSLRRADRGPVQAAPADERPLSAAARLHAAHRRALRHLGRRGRCASWPISRADTTRASAISPPAPTCNSTGSSWWTCPTFCRTGRGGDALHPDLAAIACAMSPPIISPAPRPTRSRIPRPLAEIIRQWSSLHPEFVFLARKFKIAVGASRQDRAALQYHDMAVEIVRERARPRRLQGAGGRRHGTHALHRPCDERIRGARGHPRLSGSGAARL